MILAKTICRLGDCPFQLWGSGSRINAADWSVGSV